METKEELINQIVNVEEQLNKNRRVLNPYAGKIVDADSEICRLVKLTGELLKVRVALRKKLVDKYGIILISNSEYD